MRAIGHDHKGHNRGTPIDVVVLAHDERVLRRKLLTLQHGDEVLVDLPHSIAFESGDVLVLDDGRVVEVIAGEEDLHEVRARNGQHLTELVWHIGNRHLPCQIEAGTGRLLIGRDHVIRDMLEGLGATVREVSEPFSPVRGAYGGDGHHHGHDQDHHHHHHD
jgi:urease accessory protein